MTFRLPPLDKPVHGEDIDHSRRRRALRHCRHSKQPISRRFKEIPPSLTADEHDEEGAGRSISEVVLGELRALRKRSDGASVGGIAASSAVCQALGNGDPLVARNRLQHLALEVEWSQNIEAACYSLGFASTARTHLGRLEEVATTSFLDERASCGCTKSWHEIDISSGPP